MSDKTEIEFLKRDVANAHAAVVILRDENDELLELVKLLTVQEMSDSGTLWYPNGITSCRVMDGERMGEITEKYRPTPHISTEDYHES